jgi:hypothetical protein
MSNPLPVPSDEPISQASNQRQGLQVSMQGKSSTGSQRYSDDRDIVGPDLSFFGFKVVLEGPKSLAAD